MFAQVFDRYLRELTARDIRGKACLQSQKWIVEHLVANRADIAVAKAAFSARFRDGSGADFEELMSGGNRPRRGCEQHSDQH